MEKVKVAQEAYHELLDGFHEEYKDIMAWQQFEKAKDDPDYFLVLIQLAYHYQNQIVDNRRGAITTLLQLEIIYTNIGGHYGKQFPHQIQSGHEGNRG